MSAGTFKRLAAIGLTLEQIGSVLEIMDEQKAGFERAEEARKAVVRQRVQRWRDKQSDGVTLPKRNGNVTVRLTRVEDSSSKTEITGNKEEKKESAAKPRGVSDFVSALSPILDSERIEALVAVRRKKGATFSAHAGKLLVNALRACPSVTEAADEMVLRNWTGIKPEWLESRQQQAQPRAGAPPQNRKMTPTEANRVLTEMENERQAQRDNETARVISADFGRRPDLIGVIRGAVNPVFGRGD